MELLFIFFVLYMIFSAIAKGLRAAAAQKNPPQQQGSERNLPDLVVNEDIQTSIEPAHMSAWQEHLYPDEPLLQQDKMVDESPYILKERMKPPTQEKQPPKETLLRGARSQQREVSRVGRGKKGAKKAVVSTFGLDQLIRGNNLRLAVVAAEVLSTPRSKKPFSQRNR